jgi:gallate dioxygenase
MATICAGLGLPHNPNFPALVEREGASCETALSFAKVAAEFEALRPDAIVVFTTDHLNTFFFENLPIFAIGVGDEFIGPNDEVVGVSRRAAPSSARLAQHLHSHVVAAGFDLSLVQEFEVDHSVVVPLHFVTPTLTTPVIPIFISAHNPPRPSSRRCHALGSAVRAALETWPEALRVVVIGSGSFSFDVHGHLSPPGMLTGVPDPEWAERVRGHLKRNTIDALMDEASPEQFSRAGNVSGELLNWIAMIGTLSSQKLVWIKAEPHFGNSYAVWR